MRIVIKYFLQGLLYTAPIAVTIYIFFELFMMLDSLFPLEVPGLGILFLFAIITLVGVVGSYLLKFPLFNFFDDQLERVPLVKLVYSSIKDVMKSFTGQKKGFKQPVMIRLYEQSEIRRLGFITDEAFALLDEIDDRFVTVYVPHSFAISGQLFMVPRKYITPLKGNAAEVMKYVLAGGITEVSETDKPNP